MRANKDDLLIFRTDIINKYVLILYINNEHVNQNKIVKRNSNLKRLTVKGRFFDVCFLPKLLSGPKDLSFTPPSKFTGRESEAYLHKRKVEILRFRAKRELSSNLPPKRKNRPEDRSVENFENGGG